MIKIWHYSGIINACNPGVSVFSVCYMKTEVVGLIVNHIRQFTSDCFKQQVFAIKGAQVMLCEVTALSANASCIHVCVCISCPLMNDGNTKLWFPKLKFIRVNWHTASVGKCPLLNRCQLIKYWVCFRRSKCFPLSVGPFLDRISLSWKATKKL